jgi:hypothetical protein
MPVEPLTQHQSWVSINLSMDWVNEFGCRRVVVVDELSVDELSVDELSVDELSVDELSVDELSVDKLSFDELSVDGLSPHRWNG